MSSRLMVRLSLFSLCGIAMVLSGLGEAILAQQVPPPLPPPEVSRPGGNPGGDTAKGGRGGPPPGINDRNSGRRRPSIRGAESGIDGAKPKFEDLLAEKDLSRFRGYKDEEIGDGWEINGKYLHFDGSTGSGDIITVDEYDNFELQFDFKVSEGGNSGVMFRVSLGDDQPYMSGPEYQVLDDENHSDGKNELTSAGSLYGMYAPQEKKPRAAGTWNDARIIVNGNQVTHYLNGVKVVEAEIGSDDWNERLAESKFKDWEKYAKNSKGHIAFQDHGDEVWFRNIRIKRLTEEVVARNDRDTQSDAPSDARGARGGPPPEMAAPGLTSRKPRFYAEGSGLKKDDDKDDKDKDDGDKNDSRSDSRTSGRTQPPAAATPSTRKRPRFSSQGSGLESNKDKDEDKEKEGEDKKDEDKKDKDKDDK